MTIIIIPCPWCVSIMSSYVLFQLVKLLVGSAEEPFTCVTLALAVAYQGLINSALDKCFPVVTVKRKSTEDPWITEKIRKKIRQRQKVFKKQGRSKAWKKLKKITMKMIKFHREQYIERHKIIITTPGANALFYRNVRAYNSPEKPKIWNISRSSNNAPLTKVLLTYLL